MVPSRLYYIAFLSFFGISAFLSLFGQSLAHIFGAIDTLLVLGAAWEFGLISPDKLAKLGYTKEPPLGFLKGSTYLTLVAVYAAILTVIALFSGNLYLLVGLIGLVVVAGAVERAYAANSNEVNALAAAAIASAPKTPGPAEADPTSGSVAN